MIFSDEETFAGTLLILEAMRSPNFLAGVSGWSINKDGSAEFNNITIRGSTTTQGLILMYNGTPAAGNLIVSISPTAGVDAFGNAYVAGEGLYGANGVLTARDTAGNTAKLMGNTGGGGALSGLPGLAMQLARNTGDPAIIGGVDPGGPLPVTMALSITSPSPVVGGIPGNDYSQIYMKAPSTGLLAEINLNAGNISVNGTNFDANGAINSYAAFNTYTPTVTNGGAATFTTRTGWWQRIGKMVFFTAYLVIGVAGTGANPVMVTAPTNIDRTIRQVFLCLADGTAVQGTFTAVSLIGGTGAVIDRLRSSTNVNLNGVDLTAGASITIQGMYREA